MMSSWARAWRSTTSRAPIFVASVLADVDHSTRSLVVELNRRLSDQWSLHLEGVVILAVDKADLTHYQTRRDSFIELQVTYNF